LIHQVSDPAETIHYHSLNSWRYAVPETNMVLFIEMIVTWAICAMIVFEVKQWAVSPTGNALILASVEVCLLLGANFPLLRIYIFF
jgi:hypothetical protein